MENDGKKMSTAKRAMKILKYKLFLQHSNHYHLTIQACEMQLIPLECPPQYERMELALRMMHE